MESHRCIGSKLITTFSLSQMNSVELALTLSWRENALLEEREKNAFVKPNEQRRAYSNIVVARKRTFRGTRKERLTRFTHPLAFLLTCPLVNSPTTVIFSARNLTLKVPFLSTNRSSCRKKSILAKVCFDVKRG